MLAWSLVSHVDSLPSKRLKKKQELPTEDWFGSNSTSCDINIVIRIEQVLDLVKTEV